MESIAIVRMARTRLTPAEEKLVSSYKWGHIPFSRLEQKLGRERTRLALGMKHPAELALERPIASVPALASERRGFFGRLVDAFRGRQR